MQSKKVKYSNKKVMIFCVIIILCNHIFILLTLLWAIKGYILYQMKQTALKSGYNFSTYDKLTTPAEVKNWKLETPSLLFGPLAQYLGSDKRRVLSPCVTNSPTFSISYLSITRRETREHFPTGFWNILLNVLFVLIFNDE